MEPQQARYIAAFAYILGRVAHADLTISEDETGEMEQIVMKYGRLPENGHRGIEQARYSLDLPGSMEYRACSIPLCPFSGF